LLVAQVGHVDLLLPLGSPGERAGQVTLWVSGLRGAIAFALSLRIPCSRSGAKHGDVDCRNSDLLITTTVSIVAITTLVVGTAMEKVMMALNVIEPIEPSSSLDTPMSTPTLAAGSFSVPLASDSAGGLGSPIFGPGCARSPPCAPRAPARELGSE
ncbi:unnamed protein product, partial [Prorocentrum cordatum]